MRRATPVAEDGPETLLERQKNKVRGVIGSAKGHKREAGDRELKLRESARRVLAEARYELPKAYRAEFLNWLEKVSREASRTFYQAISEGLISSIVHTRRISFAEELAWTETLLARKLSELKSFVKAGRQLDEAFWQDDWNACRATMADIYRVHGESIWLVNSEIALRQHFEGLESQKSHAASIRRKHPGGLPGYIAFYLSIRNEERSTYFLFDEDFRSQIERSKVSDTIKSFLTYKLTGGLELTENTLADTLQLEAGNSVFDLYETVIDLLQRCSVSYQSGEWIDAAVSLLRRCEQIDDPRIAKILHVFGEPTIESVPPSLVAQSRENFARHLAHDFWQAAWPMICTEPHAAVVERKQPTAARLERLLESLIHRDAEFEDSRVQLAKFTRNFSFLRSARAAGDFADFVTMRVRNTPGTLARPTLNSESRDRFDALLKRASTNDVQSEEPSAALFSSATGTSEALQGYLAALVHSVTNLDTALDTAMSVSAAGLIGGQANLLRNLILQINLDMGESDEAIRLIGQEVARTPSVINAVPAAGAIGARSWESLSSIDDKIGLSIALYALWRQTDDSLRTTHLRFSFEDSLVDLGVTRGSDVPDETIIDDERIRFFLSDICIPVLMDTSGLFSTTDELLEERLKILTKLAKVDPDNIEYYEDEATTIRASKLIKSGLEIVDSNRVSVDTGALTRWTVKRYREGYNRYLALHAAGIGSSDKFDVLIERLKATPDMNVEHFSVPDNEADSLLLGILLAIKERFVADEQYGLEYFLGKRIRHGTISGHIRGPAENAKLITERSGPGRPYEPNTAWLPRLTFRSADCEKSAAAAFSNFSEGYDKLIAEARDRHLHVKSDTHPQGILDLQMDAFRYHLVRAMIRPDIDFETFLQAYYTILWTMLDSSLHAAHQYLTDTVKNQIVQLYGALQEELRAAVVQDEVAMQLSASIQATSTAVQRELDTVGSWFVRGEAQQATHMFDLENVLEVAIQSALKSLPNFTPNIARNVIGHGKTTSVVMITIVDIVFIVFDNIHRRAKVGADPKIEIALVLSESNDRLLISVQNPISEHIDAKSVEEKLCRIRDRIASDDLVKGAFVEGESGLLKIAAHARHYSGSDFSFGLRDGNFWTTVELPVVYFTDRFSLAPREDE